MRNDKLKGRRSTAAGSMDAWCSNGPVHGGSLAPQLRVQQLQMRGAFGGPALRLEGVRCSRDSNMTLRAIWL